MARRAGKRGLGVWLAAAVCLAAAGPASGLVLQPEDAGLPASRPDDAVVGRWVNNGSCVAVGPSYVLTTRHQGYGTDWPVTIAGNTYTATEIFDHATADIRVVRLTGGPLLTQYVEPYTGTNEAAANLTVVLGGYGLGRGTELKTPGGTVYGYTWASGANDTLRWGQNRIENTGTGTGPYTSDVLVADFDGYSAPSGQRRVAQEAAPADYDSGSGWFYQEGGVWKVVALTRGVEHFAERQSWFRTNADPGAWDPDQFDGVRVSSYAGWINGILYPSAWTGAASAAWSAPENWSGGVPGGQDRWAVFGTDGAAPRTVTLDADATVGVLRFDDASPYTINGSGGLTLDSATSTCGIAVNRLDLAPYNGSHQIQVPITLRAALVLDQNSTGVLTLSGSLSGGASAGVKKTGVGTVVLAAANGFAGGLTVTGGTVRVAAAGALGTGGVTLASASAADVVLDFRLDAPAAMANSLSINSNATVHVASGGGASGQTVTMGALTVGGDRRVTFTGDDGFDLKFTGLATLTSMPAGPTLKTAGADVTLAGGVMLIMGTLTKTGTRTLAIAGPQTYGENAIVNVAEGTVRFDVDVGTPTIQYLKVNVTGAGATARFAASQHLAALNVTAGAAEMTGGEAKAIVTKALTVDPSAAKLDLGGGALIVNYAQDVTDTLDRVTAWIKAGRNGGTWQGGGITSSHVADPLLAAVGVAQNDQLLLPKTQFAGESVGTRAVLARCTYAGDANLDGLIDIDDYGYIDLGYELGSRGWMNGDFNYDGVIDIDDYGLIDYAIEFQGAPLAARPASPLAAAADDAAPEGLDAPRHVVLGEVPEPASLLLAAAGALALLARRRRVR